MSANGPSKIERRESDLLFGIRRSVRYHSKRRRFYEVWSSAISVASIVAGSATIASVLVEFGKAPTVASAATVAIAQAIALVFGLDKKAQQHSEFCRRWVELEKQLLQASPLNEKSLKKLVGERLTIEAEEPPVLVVLDKLCHNELVIAIGADSRYIAAVGPIQRALSAFFDWRPETIRLTTLHSPKDNQGNKDNNEGAPN